MGIIGAGTMGHGIALVCAKAGYDVILHDIKEDYVKKGLASVEKFIDKSVEKGKMTPEDKKNILGRIHGTTKLDDMKDADLVIEAIVEQVGLKKDVFQKLDGICKKETLFASNTSTIPITDLASSTKRPDQFIGMHFMNPVPLMKLVEVIRGLRTSDETTTIIKHLAEKMEKTPIEVNDGPGFISNRVLFAMINEAMFCLQDGTGTVQSIDTVMKLGMNHPMGPLELADLIGLDVSLNILTVLYEVFNESKYRPCPLIKKMLQAGYLGRKTGKGFYEYPPR
ncbi:MAG: 3-hydroxybutyryl-CoA dehydrogenase [Euryarchaeota archaeon]|nr:3-hydroxybutyryl-CoA dehydrogenase [Euryarchaeota archaeon]